MNTSLHASVVVLTAVLLAGPLASRAAPVPFGTSFYDVVDNDAPILWEDAKVAAEALTHDGVQGHLAVITSAAEDSFIATNFGVYFNPIDGQLFGNQLTIFFGPWIGLSAPVNSSNPADYGWVTGEAVTYEAWRVGEPSGDGRHVHYLSATDSTAVGWNDQNVLTSPTRYIVEFPNAIPEPGSLAILGLGLGALVAIRRRLPRD